MRLSDLLREIGDENLRFQVLNADMERTNINTRDAQVVFRTDRDNALAMGAGTKRAFVVWMDEAQAQAAAARLRTQEPHT